MPLVALCFKIFDIHGLIKLIEEFCMSIKLNFGIACQDELPFELINSTNVRVKS